MPGINWGRVALGGSLWFVALNALWLPAWFFLLRSEWISALAALGLTRPDIVASLALWLLGTAIGGMLAIGIYAAVRPRYGAGPKTALYVGVVFWIISALGPTVWWAHVLQLPAGLVASTLAAGLIADVVATVVGAWSYKEET